MSMDDAGDSAVSARYAYCKYFCISAYRRVLLHTWLEVETLRKTIIKQKENSL
jgi:hypothetical protein